MPESIAPKNHMLRPTLLMPRICSCHAHHKRDASVVQPLSISKISVCAPIIYLLVRESGTIFVYSNDVHVSVFFGVIAIGLSGRDTSAFHII